MMIMYLMYMGNRWLGGDLVSLETSWICIPRCEHVFLSMVPLLATDIVLIGSESRKLTFMELYMFICMFLGVMKCTDVIEVYVMMECHKTHSYLII